MTTDPKDAGIARLNAKLEEKDKLATAGYATADYWMKRYHECADERDAKAKWLGELLAVIHRDGGHYQDEHGDEKAVRDAHLIVADLRAERDAALAQVARLQHLIREASDPDFLWGAMDNVNDMDADIAEFANAASRAIRASIPILAAAEKEARR